MLNYDKLYKVTRTLAKTFLASVLASLAVFGDKVLDITWADGKLILGAGIAAVIMTGINYLNPNYTDYGFGSE